MKLSPENRAFFIGGAIGGSMAAWLVYVKLTEAAAVVIPGEPKTPDLMIILPVFYVAIAAAVSTGLASALVVKLFRE